MIVTSSYAERCLMSAQAFLAGFMPSNESFNTLPIPWQPVAVNSIPRDRDNVIIQLYILSIISKNKSISSFRQLLKK